MKRASASRASRASDNVRAPGATSIVLMVLASVWCSACAESSHDDRSAERGDRLIGGVTATGRELPSTVAIAPIPRSGLVGSAPLPGTCTAARVGDNALLLAAHCVMDPATVDPLWERGDTMALMTSPDSGWSTVVVEAVHVFPAWRSACNESYCATSEVNAAIDAPDLALLSLRDVLESDVAIAEVLDTALVPGDEVVVTGFGCTERVDEADERSLASLAFATTTVVPFAEAVHDGSPVTSADVPARDIYNLTGGPALRLRGGARQRGGRGEGDGPGLCPGDSGGPLYKKTAAGWAVVGVNANYTFLPEEDAAHGLPVTNWHTRLDSGARHDTVSWLRSLGVSMR